MVVPKVLYMFWHDGKPGKELRHMISLAKRMNPTWKVRLLSEKSPCAKPQGFEKLQPAHKSDWYRISYIEKYGGVWMDISCIHLRPLETWVDLRSAALQGFRWPGRTTTMENWAFAAAPHNAFVREWKREFESAIVMGFATYERRYDKTLLGSDTEMFVLPYLTQHAAWRVVRRRVPEAKHPEFRVTMRRSMDPASGPLFFSMAFDDGDEMARLLSTASADRYRQMPFIKLRGWDREGLRELLTESERVPCGHVMKLLRWKHCRG